MLLKDFIARVSELTISDLGNGRVKELENESRGDEVKKTILQLALKNLDELAKSQAELAKSQAVLAETVAKRDGTYLEDCDGLWYFDRQQLPREKEERLALFEKISRKTLRKCYQDIGREFDQLDPDNLPEPSTKTAGTPSSIDVTDVVDIFNKKWNNERAHLIPDSTICAPKWGHAAEGAFRPLNIVRGRNLDEKNLNDARRLLVMGSNGSRKLRKMPQNFIKFASHKEFYDVNPSVVIIPIMSLYDVLNTWEADISYDALVIASRIKKPGRAEHEEASSTYQEILSHFEYKDENFCTPGDIETATALIRDFLLGHAGSLAAGIPMNIDPDKSKEEKKAVLEELETVQQDITSDGIALPFKYTGKALRRVLKVRFKPQDGTPVPDPWLLAAKAAVNLSSTRGQKLLPACNNGEVEEDYEVLLELHEYEMRRRQTELPVEVNFCVNSCEIGETPDTPSHANRSSAVVVTPPQKGEDDWENFGD